jgi:hypothetical protein
MRAPPSLEDPDMKRLLLLCGALAALAYAAHVVIGGLLWEGYSHLI